LFARGLPHGSHSQKFFNFFKGKSPSIEALSPELVEGLLAMTTCKSFFKVPHFPDSIIHELVGLSRSMEFDAFVFCVSMFCSPAEALTKAGLGFVQSESVTG